MHASEVSNYRALRISPLPSSLPNPPRPPSNKLQKFPTLPRNRYRFAFRCHLSSSPPKNSKGFDGAARGPRLQPAPNSSWNRCKDKGRESLFCCTRINHVACLIHDNLVSFDVSIELSLGQQDGIERTRRELYPAFGQNSGPGVSGHLAKN